MEKAKLDYSPLRVFRWFFLNIQRSWIIPTFIRCYLVRLGGVKLGSKCFIGTDVIFDTLRPDLIKIGNGCVITSGTRIVTHFYKSNDGCMYLGEVNIGNNVFIGMNSLIVNSVKIGNHSVVGAGSVVLKDIGEEEVWAGNPARLIRKRE